CTRHNSPFNEIIMSAPKADKVLPAFHPLLLDEPVPENGRLKMTALDKPGFGVELNPECKLPRPYPRGGSSGPGRAPEYYSPTVWSMPLCAQADRSATPGNVATAGPRACGALRSSPARRVNPRAAETSTWR